MGRVNAATSPVSVREEDKTGGASGPKQDLALVRAGKAPSMLKYAFPSILMTREERAEAYKKAVHEEAGWLALQCFGANRQLRFSGEGKKNEYWIAKFNKGMQKHFDKAVKFAKKAASAKLGPLATAEAIDLGASHLLQEVKKQLETRKKFLENKFQPSPNISPQKAEAFVSHFQDQKAFVEKLIDSLPTPEGYRDALENGEWLGYEVSRGENDSRFSRPVYLKKDFFDARDSVLNKLEAVSKQLEDLTANDSDAHRTIQIKKFKGLIQDEMKNIRGLYDRRAETVNTQLEKVGSRITQLARLRKEIAKLDREAKQTVKMVKEQFEKFAKEYNAALGSSTGKSNNPPENLRKPSSGQNMSNTSDLDNLSLSQSEEGENPPKTQRNENEIEEPKAEKTIAAYTQTLLQQSNLLLGEPHITEKNSAEFDSNLAALMVNQVVHPV